jgi:hypothetical protein
MQYDEKEWIKLTDAGEQLSVGEMYFVCENGHLHGLFDWDGEEFSGPELIMPIGNPVQDGIWVMEFEWPKIPAFCS